MLIGGISSGVLLVLVIVFVVVVALLVKQHRKRATMRYAARDPDGRADLEWGSQGPMYDPFGTRSHAGGTGRWRKTGAVPNLDDEFYMHSLVDSEINNNRARFVVAIACSGQCNYLLRSISIIHCRYRFIISYKYPLQYAFSHYISLIHHSPLWPYINSRD